MPETPDDDVQTTGKPDPQTGVAALAARYGDVQRAAERLYETNERLLRKIERLEQRPELPEGGRVIGKEDAARYDALAALGTAEEVQAALDRATTLAAELEARDRTAARDAAARALGIEGRDLASFAGADALTFEVRDVEVEEDGKAVKRAAAFVKDAEGKEVPLADYGRERWGRPFEAVLSPPAADLAAAPTAPRTYPRQAASGAAPKTEVTAEDHRKAVVATANYVL